jgi:hypothetical protein
MSLKGRQVMKDRREEEKRAEKNKKQRAIYRANSFTNERRNAANLLWWLMLKLKG